MTILPYTRISLNKEDCLALGFFLHNLVNMPSQIRTRPGTVKGWPAAPKQLSTIFIRLVFASLFAKGSTSFANSPAGRRLTPRRRSAFSSRALHTDPPCFPAPASQGVQPAALRSQRDLDAASGWTGGHWRRSQVTLPPLHSHYMYFELCVHTYMFPFQLHILCTFSFPHRKLC